MSPHEASLHIVSMLRTLEGVSAIQAAQALSAELRSLELEKDIEAVIVFDQRLTLVEFDSLTGTGFSVLEELLVSSEFPPCPPGTCEPAHGICRWCGAVRE